MDALRQDLRFAGRALRKSPGFAITAMLTLALGIGGNSAIFSITDALILKPPPYAHADRLVVFWRENAQQGARYNEVAPADIKAVRERSSAFEVLAAWDYRGAVLTGSDEPERLQGLAIDANLFPMLGVSPALGRGFTPAEDQAGAAPVAMISHGLWQRRFAGDRGVLGRSIMLNGTPTTVIGVMPQDFHFAVSTDLWRPLALSDGDWEATNGWLRTVGRLREGVSTATAARDLDGIAAALELERPGVTPGWRFSLFRINEGLAQGPLKPMVLILLGAVAFVLLIACADVANLLLARASGRARETAIRTALGASRGRLVRQFLTESLILSGGGAIIGIVFAWWALDVVRAAMPPMILEFAPRMATLSVDARVLAFTAAVALASALIFGLAPAWRASRPDLTDVLKEAERGSTAGPGRQRVRATLVGFQVAVALVLLAGAGITMRSFLAQQNANPGFRSNNLLAMWISPSVAAYPEREQLRVFQSTILERIGALPDVEAVALSNAYPLSGEDARWPFSVDGRPTEQEPLTTGIRTVTPGYLRVLGVTFDAGRDFVEADGPGGRPVAIASESFVRRFFPGEDPIGKRITLEGDSSREIIGVVGDVQDWKTASTSMAILYMPMAQLAQRTVAIVARTRSDPATSANAIRRAVSSVDANVPVYGVRTMREVVSDAVFNQRLSSSMMSIFSLIALLLAAIGVYGVMAFAVQQRTHELGIRMALGARAHNVTREVVVQGMRPVFLGVAFGIAGALGVARLLQRILFDGGGPAIVPLSGAAAVLVLVALLAIALPVWRATRVDPMIALRNE